MISEKQFQSTPACERATEEAEKLLIARVVSIHARV